MLVTKVGLNGLIHTLLVVLWHVTIAKELYEKRNKTTKIIITSSLQ